MSMFCYQCQETAKGTGCEVRGVCGKSEEVAKLQDLLLYVAKGISRIIYYKKAPVEFYSYVNKEIVTSLFMTITNANFDDVAIEKQIKKLIEIRDNLKEEFNYKDSHDSVNFEIGKDRESMLLKAADVGILATPDEDLRSLRSAILYGLKGMAAYTEHALNIGEEDYFIYAFIYKALALCTDDRLEMDDLVKLTLGTGEHGIKSMALLDGANVSRFGNPEITKVKTGVGENPGILISGHDFTDLKQLLDQTKDTGVDIYTHGEMLPAHYYPEFKKYKNLVGNYGGSWWKQLEEFETFNGPVLFTTNCIVPPRNEEVKSRIFTTGAAGYPGCRHIKPDADGVKDFKEIIELAKTLKPPKEIEDLEITGGFAHNQVISMMDKIVDLIRAGDIKRFFVMGGCDGRMKSREYYTEFAKSLPKDTVILTAGCAKYRYIKLDLGDIKGVPRVLDAGQCNDSYSIVLTAMKLKEALGLENFEDLPITFNIAWYEQKAVIVLLSLLSLGIKNIHLGPTLPGFLSPKVRDIIIDKFNLTLKGEVEEDLKLFLG